MHGVNEEIEETTHFLFQKFADFDTEMNKQLQTLPSDAPIKIASSMSPQYVHDTSFRLMFMRADNFRITKAVTRMILFFDMKLYLFGRDKLIKTITMDDLDKNDRTSLESGFIQLMPIRDRAGRAIFVLMLQNQTYTVPENMTRAMYYVIMSALEDEETQRKGITIILYNVGDFNPRKTDLRTVSQGGWLLATIPMKACSLHHCFSDQKVRRVINFSMRFFSDDARARCKVHCGTGLECVYALMTYGIPPHVLPVSTMDGIELKRKNHVEWLRMRKQQEASTRAGERCPRIVVPTNLDILFGRGKKYREHLGNMKMVDVLEENLERYESVGLKEKSVVISEVTQEIKSRGARFLKLENNVWKEVDDKLAKEKVSHGFRTRIRINSPDEDNSSVRGSPRPREVPTSSSNDAVESHGLLEPSKRARVVHS